MLFLLLLLSADSGWAQTAQCNQNSGPAGTVSCVDLSGYYTPGKRQWATCLTNTYIRQKSGGKHRCRNIFATYCWYQCMLEVHNRGSGDVWKDCSCTSQGPTPTESLPSWCYSPAGDSCKWYRECLERKHPCEDTSNAYAIRYAEKFCNLYGDNYNKFTYKGQKWVDAVRKCLQVSLVPLIRPWNVVTCKQLRAKAFASHVPCYVSPDKNAPSICDLPPADYLKVFWTIKGSFFNFDTVGETLKGLWKTGSACSKNFMKDAANRMISVSKFVIKKFKSTKKRSVDPIPESDLQQRFADRVCLAISQYQKWNKKAFDWFCYDESNSTNADPDTSTVNLILGDTKSLGLNVNEVMENANLNSTIQDLADAITQRKLPLRVDGANVWVKSLQVCNDISCNSSKLAAVSDKPPIWHGRGSGVKLCFGGAIMLSFLISALTVVNA